MGLVGDYMSHNNRADCLYDMWDCGLFYFQNYYTIPEKKF